MTTIMIGDVPTQIMWKDMIIILIGIYVLRNIMDLYIIKRFKKLHTDFLLSKWEGLEERMVKHRDLCNAFSGGPFNKHIRDLHNSLCIAIGSMALINGDDYKFLQQMEFVNKEQEFELKPFMLSLYYRWKNNEEEAFNYYQAFLKCKSQKENLSMVMERVFGELDDIQKSEAYSEALKSFKNPAIIMLLEANGILAFEEGVGSEWN